MMRNLGLGEVDSDSQCGGKMKLWFLFSAQKVRPITVSPISREGYSIKFPNKMSSCNNAFLKESETQS